jgi:uncharacterized SAM-binding protein YcdF (DUF218 family)
MFIKNIKIVLQLLMLFIVMAIYSSCSFSEKNTRRLLTNASTETYDMIIVPGIPLRDGVWDRTMKARVYWSKYLFDKGIAKNIMFSGSSVYTPYYEGDVMALYAEAIGIPKENIFSEIKAEHSTENLYYGYYKSKKLGFSKIALATDPFQAKQLRSFAKRRFDEKVSVIPIVFDTLKSIEPLMTDPKIDYQKAFNKDFKSIVDRESLWKRLKGTISWNIDKKAYK